MLSLQELLIAFLDTLTGHITLAIYLFAVTDENRIGKRLKRLPMLILSPLTATVIAHCLYTAIPELGLQRYFITSFIILAMCTLWTMWTWRMNFWKSFSSVCMASTLQVATAALIFQMLPSSGEALLCAATSMIHILIALTVTILLKKLHFGAWFRLLLEDEANLYRTALLIFALELVMESFLLLKNGILETYFPVYHLLVIALAALIAGLLVHLAQRFQAGCMLQAQQDIIVQQQLYEHNLEEIRREVRAFRHDYKNLLAGLSQQAGAGELDRLRRTLAELDADFDQRLGEKIQASTQIGNLQIPQVRSLLLSKLAMMNANGVECRLEVLYPIESIRMDVWDFVRCLGILTDNALEAALETERSWVEIVLLAQGERLMLRVSNSWTEAANPSQFWNEGWSTKGTGRGLGLSSYRQILKEYPNTSSATSWKDGVFVQELIISGA